MRGFRIVRRLGVGGFAFVFLVERARQRFVLKMAARSASEADEDQVDAWMRREVASLESFAHPHLLPVLEWGRWPDPKGGYGYFVTPYVAGVTFHAWRWRERASLFRCVGVLCELLKALEVLHARGVCHRDLKADNLLVRNGEDAPLLIDFGAAHLPWARTVTEGLAPGTLHCQPPEAISFLLSEAARKGARLEARPSADLYAVGALLYETLTNCRAFSARMPLDSLVVAIATALPLEPRQLAPGVPASLCELTLRLLEKDPERRPPSARAVREELERLRADEGHTDSWQAPAVRPSECARLRESFPGVDVLEETRAVAEERFFPPRGWRRRLAVLVLGLGALGLGWRLLHVVPAPPAPSEKGTPPVFVSSSSGSLPSPAPSRLCTLLGLLGVASSQLAGCATTPVRPDPERYLSRCPPEARATPVKLGILPDENASFVESGTPASDIPIEEGGSLNIQSGPVTASMYVEIQKQEVLVKITGVATTTPNRVYIQFDRMQMPDGAVFPICGVAIDDLHQYGIPTYRKLPAHGSIVDPAKVDPTPGSEVLNMPRFETVLQGPEGYPVPRVGFAPPDWR